MLCVPVTDISVDIIATKFPLESVVMVNGVVEYPLSCEPTPMAVPSYDIVICEFGANLVPVILTSVPTLTALVLSEIARTVDIGLVVADAVFDGELVPTELIADIL